MRNSFPSVLVCLGLLLGCVSCRQHDYRTLTIHVPEMRNSACERVIRGAISRTPGLKQESIKVDLAARTITVTFDTLLAADKNIEFMVAKAGFEANGIPADKKAAAALPPDLLR
ncbi:MAG: heavy-metal-associated domain-containing protein [Verrucomicrobia bacterium]|jgi:copper chaperone CopZ|nr:heavy-metal-associated domain-containing protein [Verrucomicrobiota bacterium]